jgi:Protein of unknown function (DUF3499)
MVAIARFAEGSPPVAGSSGMLSATMDPVVSRRCARPDCAGVAAASLSFDYRARTVWLDEGVEPEPSRHDLCVVHASKLRVPHGWRLIDRRRRAAVVVPAPAAG